MPRKIENEEEKKVQEVVESIATNIAQLSRSVSALLGGRLKKKSLLVLLAHQSGQPQWIVEKVLDALADMEKVHLK